MSEQASPPEQNHSIPLVSVASPTVPHHNPAGRLIARMSITQMTVALVLVIFLWQWFDAHRQINTMQQELARRLAEMEGYNKAGQVLVTQGLESVRELTAKVSLLEARYAEAQNQRAALEALYQDFSSSRDEMALADVEQMLMIAGQQLQLSANVKAALIAMQQADDRLKRMDRAALNNLRAAVSRDMDRLRALPSVDIPAINARLDDLILAINVLPLEQDIAHAGSLASPVPATPKQEEGTWQKLLHEIWDDIKQLVRIENTQKNELPLLAPTQTYFLRENLKLRLLSARLALLSRDETSFKHDLQLAQAWLTHYFNAQSGDVIQAVTSLQKLRLSSINIDMPDVSASLEAARIYRASLVKAAK